MKKLTYCLATAVSLYSIMPCAIAEGGTAPFSVNDNPFKYSSYYQDSESGNYYLKARYYSPALMRFISRDTYDLSNRYAYGDGNPVGNIDPDGHMSKGIWASIELAVGIAAAIACVFLPEGALAIGFRLANAAPNVSDVIKSGLAHNIPGIISGGLMVASGLVGAKSAQPSIYKEAKFLNALKEQQTLFVDPKDDTCGVIARATKALNKTTTKSAILFESTTGAATGVNIESNQGHKGIGHLAEGAVIGGVAGILAGNFYGKISSRLTSKAGEKTWFQIMNGAIRESVTTGLQSTSNIAVSLINKQKINWKTIGESTGVGLFTGAFSGVTQVGLQQNQTSRGWKAARFADLFLEPPLTVRITSGNISDYWDFHN